jgi:hypothetical protein
MHDACRVCFFECAGDLDGNVENLGRIELRGGNLPPQRDAVDELSGNVMTALVIADFVNGENVWMVQV